MVLRDGNQASYRLLYTPGAKVHQRALHRGQKVLKPQNAADRRLIEEGKKGFVEVRFAHGANTVAVFRQARRVTAARGMAQLRAMLNVKKLSPDAILPTVAHPGEDIGYDLYSAEDVTIPARGAAGVHTGIAIQFVPVAGGIVKTRSGMARKRLMCNAGVIDAGYRGEVIVLMENLGEEPYSIRKGDKIAQLLEHPFLAGKVSEAELTEAARGARGFGSTGG